MAKQTTDIVEEFISSTEKEESNGPDHFSPEILAFGFRLKNTFSTWKAYRRMKELEWLESLRQYKGLYDPDVKIDVNASKVYPKITRSKVNIVLSRLHQMLFPEKERNWEILPSPEPRVPKEVVKVIAMSLIQQQPDPQTGEVVTTLPTADQIHTGIVAFAADRCAKMSVVIDDQFTEMDYPEITKRVLRSGLMYGTGVMKGPMINKRIKRRWFPTPDGSDYEEKESTEEVPFLEFVPIWDWYPDMSVTEYQKMNGQFQRHVMSKHDLRALCDRNDFYSDVIMQYIKDHQSGDYTPENYEMDLQTIEVEAGPSTNYKQMTSSSTNDGSESLSSNRSDSKRYIMYEFWGYIDGHELQSCGVDVPDSEINAEHGVNCFVLGDRIVKCVKFDSPLEQFHVFYYEKDETSIFGEGLARVIRHSQIAIASAARMVLDNGSCVAGPNVEVNYSLMVEGTDYTSFYPRKIWFREGRGVEAQYPALRSINFDSHITELLQIVSAFREFGDEESCLPTWMIGQMVNNETAQATSGRMSMITVSIKDIVKNFDAYTESILRAVYNWNMEFNPRTDIKGDFNVKARGVQSLVMKEIRMQALTQMKATLTPDDWVYIPRRQFLIEFFKSYDMDIQVRSEEEAQKILASMQDEKAQELAYRLQEAEIAYKKSQTMAQLTKAKDKNVEAELKANTPPDSTDPRIAQGEAAKLDAERRSIESKTAQGEQTHMQNMQHKEQAHRADMASKTARTVSDIEMKARKSNEDIGSSRRKSAIDTAKATHDMAMKEKMTEASAKAKVISAKNKPKTPKKPAKPSGGDKS